MSRNSFTPSQFLRLFTKVISIFITTSVVAMFVIENAMALELTLDVGKGSYVRGEPVYGTVRLANDTGEVVKVLPDLTLEAHG